MKQILHILKRRDDPYPLCVIREQAASHRVTVVLIQDAVNAELSDSLHHLGVSVLVLSEETTPIPPSGTADTRIGYREMLSSIFSADTVAIW